MELSATDFGDDLSRSDLSLATIAKLLTAVQQQNLPIEDDLIPDFITVSPLEDVHDVTITAGSVDAEHEESSELYNELPYFRRVPESPNPYDLIHSTIGNGFSFPSIDKKHAGLISAAGDTNITVNHHPTLDMDADSFGVAFWIKKTTNGKYGIISKKETTQIIDTFDSTLDGWVPWGDNSYNPTHDTEHDGSAKVSGDGISVHSGMQKEFNVSDIGDTLSFDYRVKSDYASSSVTNIKLKILDPDNNDEEIYNEGIVLGGTLDTLWQNYSKDISSIVQGKTKIKVVIYLIDVWSTDWNQTFWVDNFTILANSNTDVGFDVWIDGNIIHVLISDGINQVVLSITDSTINDGEFHSIIVNVSNMLEIFVDGISKGSISRGSVGNINNLENVILFARNDSGTITDKLDGSIAWLVWKKEIFSPSQIADYHSNQILDLRDVEVITIPGLSNENPQPNCTPGLFSAGV